MEEFIAFAAIVVIGFILFTIYYFFKQIQFVIVSVNLYKKIVKRQDAMIKILLDIRDQTKSSEQKEIIEQLEEESNIDSLSDDSITKHDEADEESLEFCYHCGAELKPKVKTCPKCGKKL